MTYQDRLYKRFNDIEESYGVMKNTRPTPIGKTGFFARKVPSAGGGNYGHFNKITAPATYRVINPEGKEVQSFLKKSACARWVKTIGLEQHKFLTS